MEAGRDERGGPARGDRHRRFHRPLRQARGQRRAEEGRSGGAGGGGPPPPGGGGSVRNRAKRDKEQGGVIHRHESFGADKLSPPPAAHGIRGDPPPPGEGGITYRIAASNSSGRSTIIM